MSISESFLINSVSCWFVFVFTERGFASRFSSLRSEEVSSSSEISMTSDWDCALVAVEVVAQDAINNETACVKIIYFIV